VPGTFERAVRALEWAREIGLMTQINTTVTRLTQDELSGIAHIASQKGVATWEVFFLVPVGRGALLHQLSPEEYEEVMHWLYQASRDYPLKIRTTEGPHFRRVVMQQRKAEGSDDQALVGHGRGMHLSDGNGFVFVSATGQVCPSGFLAYPAGNVRQDSLLDLYQNSPLFRQLRDKNLLKGKCGICEYKQLCGGSRARAWAETGDYLEADPRCSYVPRGVVQPNAWP
jgi:radical SAM protein with 4Fe4S-binding SPASM domain